jgi:hypothetical protein
MKNLLIIFSLLAFVATGCKRHLTHEETETALNAAMQKFLISQPNLDTTKVKFNVVSVEYFEDKLYYDCEFKIKMTLPGHADTLGMMGARVSRDFSDVKRRY